MFCASCVEAFAFGECYTTRRTHIATKTYQFAVQKQLKVFELSFSGLAEVALVLPLSQLVLDLEEPATKEGTLNPAMLFLGRRGLN